MVTAERNSVKSKAGSDKLPALNLTNISVNLAVEIRISVEKDTSEPVSNWEKVRIIFAWCTNRDSNPGPTGYEPVALTN